MKALDELTSAWNHFWFDAYRPCDGRTDHKFATRAFVGLAVIAIFSVHLLQDPTWFGESGWFNSDAGRHLGGEGIAGTGMELRWTPLYSNPSWIAPICYLGILTGIGMLTGRLAQLCAFLAFLSLSMLHHRAPLFVGRGEPLLIAMLLYSTLIPSRGVGWLTRGRLEPSCPDHWTAHLGYRLVQVHFVLWIAFSLASMLGQPGWWSGEAVRQLLADRQGWMPDAFAVVTNAEILAHATILAHVGILAAAFFSRFRFVGPLFLAVLILAILLVIGDWTYAMVLGAASTSIWHLPLRKSTKANT